MKILVTAGPTREPIDPVRFISNRSTGKMGFAIAKAGIDKAHDVRLISGPVHIPAPDGVEVISIVTAEEMLDAVQSNVEWCDVLIMSAAVADWKPADFSKQKIKKSSAEASIQLEATQDILMAVSNHKKDRLYIGFAAESEDLLKNARKKLQDKALDLIVANDISGFESDANEVTLITASDEYSMPLLSKKEVAEAIIDWVDKQRS